MSNMNENINLCEILKDCPKGTELYSSVHGKVLFSEIDNLNVCPIEVIAYGYDDREFTASFTTDGRFLHFCIAECVLFPSKDQRDWSKFTAPWLKKEKFDPKTLQPFDKVLVRDYYETRWTTSLFSYVNNRKVYAGQNSWRQVIPYNEETKYLVGTSDEAPERYRYWED